MNALILLGIVLLVFIMGYRFYAKFLVLGVFRIENDVPTPARQHGDTLDFSPCNRWLLLGHNAAAHGSEHATTPDLKSYLDEKGDAA